MNKKKYDGCLYELPYVETLKEIIDKTTSEYPDAPAYMYKVEHGEPYVTMTFGEFKHEQNALGTALLDLGLKGSKIAVIGENSHLWALSYFTVVCGVGTIVPIDKNLESEEIINLLTRAEVELIFASRKSVDKVREALERLDTLHHLVVMDFPNDDMSEFSDDEAIKAMSELIARGAKLLEDGNSDYISAEIKPHDVSTILFTSGTTGLAKGVILSHMNLAQNIFNMSKYFKLPDDARVLSILPIHHAYECTCTLMTSFYQAKTVVMCEGLKYIQSNFIEAGCSVMLGVPLVFENIYRKIWKQAEKQGDADKLRRAINLSKSLRLSNNKFITKRMFKSIQSLFGPNFYEFVVGGAAIDPKVIADFEMMGMPMIQGYGMTECAPIIAMNSDRYSKAASAGKPVPGTEVRIVDADDSGIGEIICKGPSVMVGYYNDPESTAATIKDGWLYTGDYGYLDEENFLFITGRKKNVIVTKGGKNIFPEEVEYYILLEPYVSEVMVYGKSDDTIKDDLVCTAIIYPDYISLKEKKITDNRAIYDELKRGIERANAKMPPYKRVKRIEIRDKEFIKTTTLKIKRFEEENYEYEFDDKTIKS